jgi:hypothetical protein
LLVKPQTQNQPAAQTTPNSSLTQGIELYKENLALGDRLTAYYAAMQAVPALQHIINFPQLAPLPADFLTAMEEYVREAPKEVDPSLAGGGRGHGPVTGNR